jgi:hypothetical protein
VEPMMGNPYSWDWSGVEQVFAGESRLENEDRKHGGSDARR